MVELINYARNIVVKHVNIVRIMSYYSLGRWIVETKSETVFRFFEKEPPLIVLWSHYLQLVRIENEAERSYYEIETDKTGWEFVLCRDDIRVKDQLEMMLY